MRFFAGGNLAVTIRRADVEQVLCPSPTAGTVNVADLGDPSEFVPQPLSALQGTLAAMVQGA